MTESNEGDAALFQKKKKKKKKKNVLLRLCLCAFSDAARNAALEFMGRSKALVAFFKPHSHSNTVSNTKTTPTGPDTALEEKKS